MKKSLIYSWLPILLAAMATFSLTACGSDNDENETTPATIIGKWKVMTIDSEGKETGDYQICCFNADGTSYDQQFNADGTSGYQRSYTYTFDGTNIYRYSESGKLKDALLNVKVTATTLTATSVTGFTATMIRVYDDGNDKNTDDSNNNNSGKDDNESNTGKDDNESNTGKDDNESNTGNTPATVEAIDLGLSVKWANCNVGATAPEEYGGYYAWGETEEKECYDWSTYKYYKNVDGDANGDECTKYVTNKAYGYEHITDNRTTLEPTDDVAHVKWGGNWRMPTQNELYELVNKCIWRETTLNGVYGYKITGPNGNSIFLPCAGYYYGTDLASSDYYTTNLYWSSMVAGNLSYSAFRLPVGQNFHGYYYTERCCGLPVRPVCD